MNKLRKNLKSQPQGFTLIEMLIYVSLLVVITLVFTNFTLDVLRNTTRSVVTKEVNQNARLVLSRIAQEVKTANSIDDVTSTHLKIKNKDDEVVWFYLDPTDDRVYYQNFDQGMTEPISGNSIRVTNLSFTWVTADSISMDITLAQKNINAQAVGQYQNSFSLTVVPRQLIY